MKWSVLALACTSCIASHEPEASPDPSLGGKADGTSDALDAGTLAWDAPTELGLTAELTFVSFELTDSADVSLETAPTSDQALTSTLYLYRPAGELWGTYLEKSDDGTITSHLTAGLYRAVVMRRSADLGSIRLNGTCNGEGCTPPLRGCTPREPRTVAPEVFVGPTSWQSRIDAAIDGARTTLDIQMYLFNVTEIAGRIIAAAHRGVVVRVLLDPDEPNDTVKAMLAAAGVPVHTDPPQFSYAHAKYMVIDGTRLVIQSGNFNGGAITEERNYAFVDRDRDDIADAQAIFRSDWSAGASPDLACTRLVVSPINSGDRILAHVESATHTLDVEVLYLNDADIRDAIIERAQHDVTVRVLLSDPQRNPQNIDTQSYLVAHGVPTKILLANYVHAKMIQADGIALVGSENMSATSFTKNREVGALVFEPTSAMTISTQFDQDWAAAR